MNPWPTAPLGDVATIERKSVRPAEIPIGTPYLGLEDIARGGDIVSHSVIGEVTVASGKFVFSSEHILYGKLRPNLAKIARPAFDGVCSTDILPVLPGPKLDKNYLAHFLSQPVMIDFAASRATGANLPRLGPSELARFQVPLPPIDEQRRIATILDRADALRAKRRRTLELYDKIIASKFAEISERAGTVRRPLGEVADCYAGSSLPAGTSFHGQEGGYFLLKVSDMNLSGNERSLESAALWSQQPGSRSATVSKDAVVIPKRGGAIGTNKKRTLRRPAVLDPNLMAIVPTVDSLSVDWLFEWFRSLDLNQLVSGSSVPQLNKKDLTPLQVPVPSRKGEAEFNVIKRNVASLTEASVVSVERMDVLFASLRSHVFSGRL